MRRIGDETLKQGDALVEAAHEVIDRPDERLELPGHFGLDGGQILRIAGTQRRGKGIDGQQ
ncbi:hypothetical protein D3C71_1983890 [compost metagenome]